MLLNVIKIGPSSLVWIKQPSNELLNVSRYWYCRFKTKLGSCYIAFFWKRHLERFVIKEAKLNVATVPHPGSLCTVKHQGTRQRRACHCTAARETTRAGRTRACQRIQYNPNPNLKIILSRFMFNTNMGRQAQERLSNNGI